MYQCTSYIYQNEPVCSCACQCGHGHTCTNKYTPKHMSMCTCLSLYKPVCTPVHTYLYNPLFPVHLPVCQNLTVCTSTYLYLPLFTCSPCIPKQVLGTSAIHPSTHTPCLPVSGVPEGILAHQPPLSMVYYFNVRCYIMLYYEKLK